jgi:hypothetical protein
MFSLYSVFRLQQTNTSNSNRLDHLLQLLVLGDKIYLSDGDKNRIDIIADIGIFGKS